MDEQLKIIYKDLAEVTNKISDVSKDLSGKTLLITGPNGLLASYIVDTIAYLNDKKLLDKPCKVIGLSRSKIEKSSRLGHLLNRKDIKFITHDVIDPYNLESEKQIDYIIHAAGRSAPATFQSDPLGTIDVNVKGIRWLLDYTKDNPIKSFLYMSSGETYGNPTPENIPTPETYPGNVSPLAPRACYTESKRLSETLCNVYFQQYQIPVKIARPFIVYGPGLPITDRRVMADFMRFGIEGTPIEMLSEGLDKRSYCYISDATVAFFRMLLSDHNGEAFNIANDAEEISIRDLAENIHEICGIKEPVTVKKSPDAKFISDAPKRVLPDISKAKKLLKYDPEIGISEGLKRTVNWNKAFFNKYV